MRGNPSLPQIKIGRSGRAGDDPSGWDVPDSSAFHRYPADLNTVSRRGRGKFCNRGEQPGGRWQIGQGGEQVGASFGCQYHLGSLVELLQVQIAAANGFIK